MKAMKPLMLAAFATVSLAAVSAMAQGQNPSEPTNNSWPANPTWSNQAAPPNATRVQAGSSDPYGRRSGSHVLPFNGDYGDLANPN
jgi:hypothetical protein